MSLSGFAGRKVLVLEDGRPIAAGTRTPPFNAVLADPATPEALDKSLRRLDEQARATIDEQGVNVLFLALGFMVWATPHTLIASVEETRRSRRVPTSSGDMQSTCWVSQRSSMLSMGTRGAKRPSFFFLMRTSLSRR